MKVREIGSHQGGTVYLPRLEELGKVVQILVRLKDNPCAWLCAPNDVFEAWDAL